jgi:hypothetical protein
VWFLSLLLYLKNRSIASGVVHALPYQENHTSSELARKEMTGAGLIGVALASKLGVAWLVVLGHAQS